MTRGLSRRGALRTFATLSVAALVQSCAGIAAPVPTKVRRVGYLGGGVAAQIATNGETLRRALLDLGYVEQRDIVIDVRAADADLSRIPALFAELVALPSDIIVTTGSPAALAARQTTTTIPVVFVRASTPVRQGLVASLARPGGNLTGISAASVGPKQIEFLKALVPNLKRVAVLWNANNPGAAIQLGDIEEGARSLNVRLEAFAIHDAQELSRALEKIATSLPDGLLIAPAFNIAFDVKLISNFAIDAKLPHVFSSDLPWAAAGGLVEIGANSAAEMQRAAVFVDKIFRGARPADLPVELPTKFDVILNLTTAERMGLAIPPIVMAQATEVIR